LGLNADHSNVCKFDTKVQEDMDVYEMVRDNMYWLYEEALKQASREADEMALQERVDGLAGPQGLTDQPRESLYR
jgi:hypothetical protein